MQIPLITLKVGILFGHVATTTTTTTTTTTAAAAGGDDAVMGVDVAAALVAAIEDATGPITLASPPTVSSTANLAVLTVPKSLLLAPRAETIATINAKLPTTMTVLAVTAVRCHRSSSESESALERHDGGARVEEHVCFCYRITRALLPACLSDAAASFNFVVDISNLLCSPDDVTFPTSSVHLAR
jgi:hypothetical protein